MSDTKFTPGPWDLYSEHRAEQYIDVEVGEESGRSLFRIHHDDRIPDDQAEANARLIAAAPKGYELAEAVLTYNANDATDYGRIVELAREFMAIAKAEGRP